MAQFVHVVIVAQRLLDGKRLNHCAHEALRKTKWVSFCFPFWEAGGGLVFAFWATAHVEKGRHGGFLDRALGMKTPTPLVTGWG